MKWKPAHLWAWKFTDIEVRRRRNKNRSSFPQIHQQKQRINNNKVIRFRMSTIRRLRLRAEPAEGEFVLK